jgi:hypothetical protein
MSISDGVRKWDFLRVSDAASQLARPCASPCTASLHRVEEKTLEKDRVPEWASLCVLEGRPPGALKEPLG